MARNVEIKASVHNLEVIKQRVLDLKFIIDNRETSNLASVIMKQEDVFYNLPSGKVGKLKLRKVQGYSPELIYYDREESTGPKLSSYNKCKVPEDLESILTDALGIWGVVKKVRTLIMIGQTRVHFDSVEDLGDFVELEVVLNDNQTIEEGKKIATDLMSYMKVEEKDLISVSYINMLSQNKP